MTYSTAKTPERSVIVDPRDLTGGTDFIGGTPTYTASGLRLRLGVQFY